MSAPKRILRLPEVCERTGYSPASIWRLVKAGKLPEPIKPTGGHASGWLEHEIDAVINRAIKVRATKKRRLPPGLEKIAARRAAGEVRR